VSSHSSPDLRFRVHHDAPIGGRFTPISAEEYAAFAEVLQAGRMLLHAEEAYEVVVSNFIAWEETILGLAVRQAAGKHHLFKTDYFDAARRDLHRGLINLMTAAKAFDDQTQHMISGFLGKAADFDAVKGFFSREYDASLGYRVLCALRNHSQHNGLAVTGVSFGSRHYPGDQPGGRYGVVVSPYMHLADLRMNSRFKADVLKELVKTVDPQPDPAEDRFDLRPHVRAYMQGLSAVLVSIRERFSGREVLWQEQARMLYEHYEGPVLDEGTFSVCAERLVDGYCVEQCWIGAGPWVEIAALRDLNPRLTSLDRAVIMS
jgi:hypothetical protein